MMVVERSGVSSNLETLLRAYTPSTMTARIAKAYCGVRWQTSFDEGVEQALEAHVDAWNRGNALILMEHLEPQQIAAALNLDPAGMQAATFGALPPDVLQSALDDELKPILELATIDVVTFVFERCGPAAL